MKKQLNTGIAVTDVSVYLTITELVVLKTAWQAIMADTKIDRPYKTKQEQDVRLLEFDVFMDKLFGDVVSPEDVHQTLFSPEELPIHPEIVNDVLQGEIDRNIDAHNNIIQQHYGSIDNAIDATEEYADDFIEGNQDFINT